MVNFVAHARKMDQKSAKNGKNGTKDMKNGSNMAQKWSKHVIFFHNGGSKIEYCGLESILSVFVDFGSQDEFLWEI